jgi:hypothetical protein
MTVSTFTRIEAYAMENFRQDYLRLPAVKVELVKSDPTKLRIEDQVDITVSPQNDLHFNPDQLRQLKPFCWVDVSFEQYQKMDALLTYYVLVKYNDIVGFRSPYFSDDFRLACADVANVLKAAEAAATDSSDRGITAAVPSQGQNASRTHHFPSPSNVWQHQDPIGENKNYVQERQNLLQDLMADYSTLKQRTSTLKEKFTALENRISTLELASAEARNEDLKAKLATAEATIVKLAEENAELRKKIIWLPADLKGVR